MAVDQNVQEGMPVFIESVDSDVQEGLIIPRDINNERNFDNENSNDEDDGQNQNRGNNFMEDLLANNLNSDNQKESNSQIVSSTRQLNNQNSVLRNKSNIEKISYFKLKNHIKHNHPRNKIGQPFSILQDIGYLSLLENDCLGGKDKQNIPYIQNEIGLGASLLLITLKAFALLFFVLTIVNIPTMVLYAFGNKQQLDSFNAQQFFAMLSLGNIGQTQGTCNIQNLQTDSNMTISCAFGTLTQIVQYGITLNDSSTCNPDSQDIRMVPTCTNATSLFQNTYKNDLIKYFNKNCYGNVKCTIPFDSTKLSNQCSLIIDQRNQISKYNKTNQFQKQQLKLQIKNSQKNNQNNIKNNTNNYSIGLQNFTFGQLNYSSGQQNQSSVQQNQSNGQLNLININQQNNKNKTNNKTIDKNNSKRQLQKNNKKNNNSSSQNQNTSSQNTSGQQYNSSNTNSNYTQNAQNSSNTTNTSIETQIVNFSNQSIYNQSSDFIINNNISLNSSQNISTIITDTSTFQNNTLVNSSLQTQSYNSSLLINFDKSSQNNQSSNSTQVQPSDISLASNLNNSQTQQNNNTQTNSSLNLTQNQIKKSSTSLNNTSLINSIFSSTPKKNQTTSNNTQINSSSIINQAINNFQNLTQQNNKSLNGTIQNLINAIQNISQQQNIFNQISYNTSEPRIIMYAQCNSSNIVIPGPNIVVSKQKLGMVVVWIDIISIIIIIFFVKILKWRLGDFVKFFNKSTIKISDFTIRVKNLPLDKEFDGDESILKAQLWEHFALFLEKNNQENQQLSIRDQKHQQIADITFAKQEIKETAELIQLYDKYLNFQNLLHEDPDRYDNKEAFEQKIQKAEQNYMNERKKFSIYQKFQEKKENLRASIRKVKNLKNAQEDIKNQNKKSIRYAFITFRSMKALNSVLNHYQQGYFDQILSMSCCNKNREDQQDQVQTSYFYNRRLNVQKASQPDEIKWENFGYHGHWRLILRIIVWLIALGLIAGDIFGMVALKYQNDKIKEQFNYNQVCPLGFTKAQAYSDFVDYNSTQGLMGCYCQQQFNQDITSVYSILFTDIDPDDFQPYCQEWFANQTKQDAILIAIALFIIVFNLLISKILEIISSFERHHTEDELTLSQFQKILITNFTNLSVVILLVNFNTQETSENSVSFILNGDYSDFSVQWYRNIGTSICITLVMNIFSPYLLSLLKYLMQNFQRCKDRSFRKNLKLLADEKSDLVNTKLVLQSDLQNLYTGSQIQTHYVYAAIFSNMWACLMYSSGFPVLYLVAFLFYTVLYWVYKFFLIKFFQKTNKSNENLALKSISYIKYGIIIHMIVGGLMYTNISILTPIYDDSSSSIDFQDAFDYTGASYLKSRFTSNFSKIYLAFLIIFIFIFVVFDYTLAKFQNCIKKYKTNKSEVDNENDLDEQNDNYLQSSDLFMDMKASCLTELYKRSLSEYKIYQVEMKDKESISQDLKTKHFQALKQRVQSIEFVIDDHLSKLISLNKNEEKKQQYLDTLFKYSYRQKLHILMANEHALQTSKYSKDRLRMIGITQSYHINDSQQYQKAKKMMKILAKEQEQNYQLQQIIEYSEKKPLF